MWEGNAETSGLNLDAVQFKDSKTVDGGRRPVSLFTDVSVKCHSSFLMAIKSIKVIRCASG
jgi:hypothetical protein